MIYEWIYPDVVLTSLLFQEELFELDPMTTWDFVTDLLDKAVDDVHVNDDGVVLLFDLVVHLIELDLTFYLREWENYASASLEL